MAQAWIINGGVDEELEPDSKPTWGMVGEASGADSALEPQRSSRKFKIRKFHGKDCLSDQETEEEQIRSMTLSPIERESWRDIEKKSQRPDF